MLSLFFYLRYKLIGIGVTPTFVRLSYIFVILIIMGQPLENWETN